MRKIIQLQNCFRFSGRASKGREWGLTDDYEVLAPLGKGSSAKVFQGVNVVTGKKVVIKIFKHLNPESIKREIAINQQLLQGFDQAQNPHVKFIELEDTLYDTASSTFTLIYRFYHGVPLNQLITTCSYSQAISTVHTIAHTLNYIHSIGLVHRDIKPANILMTQTGPRLFDFGLAKAMEGVLKTNNFGTKGYKTPEVVYRMQSYDKSVDVWALGLVFAQLLLNKRHILRYQSDAMMLSQVASLCGLQADDKGLISEKLMSRITVSKNKSWPKLAQDKKFQSNLVDLVQSMLQINPKKRSSLPQIISHPIFTQPHLP